jgi:hypothetical protein
MSTGFKHLSLANGKWYQLSLVEQLGNIGSEVSRTLSSKGDKIRLGNAALRALELFDLTICDTRWKNRLKEITRAREIFCDIVYGDSGYGITLEDLNRYFYYFAYAARAHR